MLESKTSAPPAPASADALKTALSAGGLLAAFGVASCCALPVALSLLGISAASLVGVGYLAAHVQRELLYVAGACIAAAGIVMWRQRRARACTPGAACARPSLAWASTAALGLALALLALTFWIEPPI